MKAKKQPRVTESTNSGVLPQAFASRYHQVLYAPIQVMLSMPCFKEGEHPKVGMRLALLENRLQSKLEDIPAPVFLTAAITKVDGDLVTLKYDKHPHRAISLTGGWESLKLFCVPLTEDREAWTKRATAERQKNYPDY